MQITKILLILFFILPLFADGNDRLLNKVNSTVLPNQGSVPDATELAVLEALYTQTGGASWTYKNGWPTDWSTVSSVDDLIGAYGLVITNHDITQIDLDNNNLSGTIPTSIGDLTDLYYLQLSGNSLTGSIPGSLSNPINLQFIFLQFNQLTGSIPNALGNAPKLKMLYVHDNNLSGSLPTCFVQTSTLERLFLSGNNFSGSIPNDIYLMDHLKFLDLANNNLSGSISDSIAYMISLESLSLQQNNFSGNIPTSIGLLTDLKLLSVAWNDLSQGIPSSIGNLTSLTRLFLGNNDFSGEIPTTFSSLTSLIHFYVENNQLSGPIPEFVTTYASLTHARFQQNAFNSLPDFSLHVNSSQINMNVQGNQIPQSDIDANMSAFQSFTYNDQSIYEGSIPDDVELAALRAIVENLGVVYPYDGSNTAWPSLSNWPSGINNTEFDDWWGIEVYDGDIVGLYLEYTGIEGHVPSQLNDLADLEVIFLGSNYIKSLPNLSGLSQLKYFELSSNPYAMPFPEWLDKLEYLEVINLAYSKYKGHTNSDFRNLYLTSVWLNDNELISIPSFEHNYSNSNLDLDIENNKLRMKYLDDLRNNGVYNFSYSNQTPTYEFLPRNKSFIIGDNLEYSLRDPESNYFEGNLANIEWQKKVNGSWVNVTNEDPDDYGSLLITNSTESDAGTYRFIVTHSIFTDLTLYGPEILFTPVNQELNYSGHISAISWKGYNDSEENLYLYSYDDLNRLTTSHYSKKTSNGWKDGIVAGEYNTAFNYDLNGNILSLTRNSASLSLGADLMDNLTYIYRGNQLFNVHDNANNKEGFSDGGSDYGKSYYGDYYQGDEYTYDANGNMISDLNKGISLIKYNHLNLPVKVIMEDGNYVEYVYDAAGIKQAQIVHENGAERTTEYEGEYIYNTENDVTELELIQHEEGRITYNNSTSKYEYQYHLKDHLGNVRLTFTSDPKSISFPGTFESELASPEEDYYYGIQESRELFNSADASLSDIHVTGDNEVVRTNNNNPFGAGISLPVAKGDKVDMEVYAYFEGGSGYSTSTALGVLISAVGGGFGGSYVGTEAQQITYNAFDNALSGIGLLGTSSDSEPAAYLNYILFDEHLVYYQHGHVKVSSSANFAHEKLELNQIEASKHGFIYIYLSNESNSPLSVYFDDMKVTVHETPIIQNEDYYPFGLTFNSYQRVTAKENNYLYNGKELQDELKLNWLDFSARMYMPDIGRWWVKDPLSEFMMNSSPYQYGHNNPVNFNDPSGMMPEGITSTFIDPSGTVLDHRPDDDRNVYLVMNVESWDGSKNNLPIAGKEDPNKKYQKGDKWTFYQDPLFGPFESDVVDLTGHVTAFTETALDGIKRSSVLNYIPVINEDGDIIAWFKTYEKVTFKAIKITSKGLEVLGGFATVASIVSDISQYGSGEIGIKRLSYRIGGTVSGLWATAASGSSGVGFIVGGLFVLGELSWNSMRYLKEVNKDNPYSVQNLDEAVNYTFQIDEWLYHISR
jgi:RHS repeat-associated protein